jgi:hypothetical protein
MTQIGSVREIQSVKDLMNKLVEAGYVKEWEIPYENILTRLSAAIFFLTPVREEYIDGIWEELGKQNHCQYRLNEEKNLSRLQWRVEFNKGV